VSVPRRLLAALASLRLTVVLLTLAIVLIFAGTLAQATQGVWQVVDTYFRSWVAFIDVQMFVPRDLARAPWAVPFPGGLAIAGAMVVNLLAAHAVRFKATGKRAGIILLHAGVVVLLLGEFVTAFTAREGIMSIDEGARSGYVEDIRSVELAVVDAADPAEDHVTVFPQALLEQGAATGAPIAADALPFAITVLKWLPNSAIVQEPSGGPMDREAALRLRATEQPRARGVDGADVDVPGAYIRLSAQGRDLGDWLVSAHLRPQTVEVGGRRYALELRFERTYKPYTIELIDFRHDKFTGTEIARNFSSHVRLRDPSRGVEREAVISMNEPLRYQGETFYQASFKPDNSGTVLQVVRNPAWLMPYLSCIMVGLGLIVHFAVRLSAFVGRRQRQNTDQPRRGRWLLAGAAGLGMVISLHALFRPAPRADFQIAHFIDTPVSSGGRVKPFDTVARSALLAAAGRQSIRTESGSVAAAAYVLDLIARPERIKDVPVVKVDHPDLLTLLGQDSAKPARLSLAQVEPKWEEITAHAGAAMELPPKQRDPYQRAAVKLYAGVSGLLDIARMGTPYWVPPESPGGEWRRFHEAFQDARAGAGGEGAATIARVMTAYHDSDQAAFDQATAAHKLLVEHAHPGASARARLEVWFSRAEPFLGTAVVYVLGFLLLCAALLIRARAGGERLRTAGVGLIAGALLIHTLALALRMYLQGRPPVTNLYSSAVFVGWAGVGLGLLLERWYPVALAALAAAAVGFSTLIIAHNLGNDGDTMQVMQAVLDTNFWLATHVVTITLGYSASLVAGLLGAVYLLTRVISRRFTDDRAAALSAMIYGVVCFAMLLSFVGTVLGGIWADQSWGRFWGWDPKENGAALVVLMNAVILHARWGGLARQPGIAALAVLGNAVVAWSWFGTNMLGVGLHSYGFMDSAVFWLVLFVCINFALAAAAWLPARPPMNPAS
jgi:ABC-type transport system involved in cytochrome c biogenesis permease subunit